MRSHSSNILVRIHIHRVQIPRPFTFIEYRYLVQLSVHIHRISWFNCPFTFIEYRYLVQLSLHIHRTDTWFNCPFTFTSKIPGQLPSRVRYLVQLSIHIHEYPGMRSSRQIPGTHSSSSKLVQLSLHIEYPGMRSSRISWYAFTSRHRQTKALQRPPQSCWL